MKKIFLYITIFAILCFSGSYSIDYTIGKQLANRSPYYLSFSSIGANSLTSNLDAWAKIKTTSSNAELEAYMIKILTSLQFPLVTDNMTRNEKDGNRTIFYQVIKEDHKMTLVLESDEIKNETYMVISISGKDDINQLKAYESKLRHIIGINWTSYYTYRGQIDNVIAYDAQSELIKVMLKNLGAKEINWYKNGKITSCAAYSPRLSHFSSSVEIENQKCNLQIAIQPDEKTNKTYIIIGCPLILGEY